MRIYVGSKTTGKGENPKQAKKAAFDMLSQIAHLVKEELDTCLSSNLVGSCSFARHSGDFVRLATNGATNTKHPSLDGRFRLRFDGNAGLGMRAARFDGLSQGAGALR